MTNKPRVVILGAGPAGLGAAYRLAQRGAARVTVLEQNPHVGGNAGSFELAGLRVDFGSHRLHPSCDPDVLHDIHSLLGDDLLDRPRHGRIRLRGRWIHFPLKPLDLAFRLPPQFAAGTALDMAGRVLRRAAPARNGHETFATVLEAGLGKTICRDFYFPYARKIWGLDPQALDVAQARRRVSASSPGKMLRKVLSAVPGLKPKGAGRFFYPRQGFGQISDAYCRAAVSLGAAVHLSARVQAVELAERGPHTVRYVQDGQEHAVEAEHVWSTIPLTLLARLARPAPPPEDAQAAGHIAYRAMLLIYLVLDQAQFSEYDAHYFPEAHIPITRLSEPKNYAASAQPQGCTVLCAELPCSPDDAVWQQSDESLGRLVTDSLAAAGIPVQAPIRQVVVRRLRHAYPIYREGYAPHFDRLDRWAGEIDGLLTFGRQGLFAHDNTHHALYMAYCAVACLGDDGHFDRTRWQAYRRQFESHVVED